MPKSRTLLTVAFASMALVVVGVPAAAHTDSDDTHRGKYGRHAFVDTGDKPGARCVYREVAPSTAVDEPDATMELVAVSARAPKVAAKNRTKRIDRQPVAWRFVLQERVEEGEWTKVKRSRLQLKRANDRSAAKFSRLGVKYDANPNAEYRVQTRAYWLSKRNPLKKVGVVTHLVDNYRVLGAVSEAPCLGSTPAPEAP
jgi:hypothetical protein